jgi:hypothetical protein
MKLDTDSLIFQATLLIPRSDSEPHQLEFVSSSDFVVSEIKKKFFGMMPKDCMLLSKNSNRAEGHHFYYRIAGTKELLEKYLSVLVEFHGFQIVLSVVDAATDAVLAHGMVKPEISYNSRPIDEWFELSYSSYLTIPRLALSSMGVFWQNKFVALLEELDNTLEWRPEDGYQYRCELNKVDNDRRDEEYWLGPVLDPLANYRYGEKLFRKAGSINDQIDELSDDQNKIFFEQDS